MIEVQISTAAEETVYNLSKNMASPKGMVHFWCLWDEADHIAHSQNFTYFNL